MDFNFDNAAAQKQNDEFDIDLRLDAGSEPSESLCITGLICSTNSSTCFHTSPKLCC